MPSSFYCTLRCHFRTRSIIFAYPFYVTVWKEENNKIGWFKKLSFGVLFVGDARVHWIEVPWKDVDFITIWVVSAWHVSSIFAINTEYYATCTVINSILRVFERDMKYTSSFISCADWKPSLLIIFSTTIVRQFNMKWTKVLWSWLLLWVQRKPHIRIIVVVKHTHYFLCFLFLFYFLL